MIHTFKEFKCSNRYWWKVTVENTGNTTPTRPTQDEFYETDWKYYIYRDEKLVWEGIHSGQYNDRPTLKDIMYEWEREVTNVTWDGVWADGVNFGKGRD